MSEKNIYQRVNDVIAEGKVVEKNGSMTSGGTFKFHKVDDVLAHLRPFLVKNGIKFCYSVVEHEYIPRDYKKQYNGKDEDKFERTTVKHVECRLINIHNPEDMIVGREIGYGIDPQDKGPGKATSYAVKTWLLNEFLLRGQPDENTVTTRDGVISKEQVSEVRLLLDRAFTEEETFLAYLGVESLEDMQLSKLAIAKRDLMKKADKLDETRRKKSEAVQSVAPDDAPDGGSF